LAKQAAGACRQGGTQGGDRLGEALLIRRVPGGQQGAGGVAEARAGGCLVLARGGGAMGFYDFAAVAPRD
jgi:hypothetical protein